MRALALVALLIAGCGVLPRSETRPNFQWPLQQLEAPPSPDRYTGMGDGAVALGNYAADTSLYAYYVFHHARTVNQQAAKTGWNPPALITLCEGFVPPETEPIPEQVKLSEDAVTPTEIAKELAVQYKLLLKQYRDERKHMREAYEKHRRGCLF